MQVVAQHLARRMMMGALAGTRIVNELGQRIEPQPDGAIVVRARVAGTVEAMRWVLRWGRAGWERCAHPWVPTDAGAAVVVKGTTRIYWAHKASIVSFADSEVPIDVRVCQYAAER